MAAEYKKGRDKDASPGKMKSKKRPPKPKQKQQPSAKPAGPPRPPRPVMGPPMAGPAAPVFGGGMAPGGPMPLY